MIYYIVKSIEFKNVFLISTEGVMGPFLLVAFLLVDSVSHLFFLIHLVLFGFRIEVVIYTLYFLDAKRIL